MIRHIVKLTKLGVSPRADALRSAIACFVVLALTPCVAHGQVNSGSSCTTNPPGTAGCLGDITYSVDTVVPLPPDGVLNYATLTVATGATLRFQRNALNTPVTILASGDVTLNGAIDVSAPAAGTPGGAANTGSTGDGNIGDDGVPGIGGPGSFSGGVGGKGVSNGGSAGSSGGVGLGPGGGGPGSVSSQFLRAAGGGFGTPGEGINGSATAGVTYGQQSLLPLVGGSGGGGGAGGSTFNGAGGGGGGGAILIATSGALNVSSTGKVVADGGSGGQSRAESYCHGNEGFGGAGGGGAGGAIRLVAQSLIGNGPIYARAASGGVDVDCGYARGGAGGAGRIRIEATSYTHTGQRDPVGSVGAPGPVFVPNTPTLRIAAVGGQPVPASPTGSGDVSFPANAANTPVEVTFAATNIPRGTTVSLIVKPQTGAPAAPYISGALAGQNDSATTATVSNVILPAGPSVLEAQAQFTIVLSGFAASKKDTKPPLTFEGEAIEKAEVRATTTGKTEVIYVTSSKKRIPEAKVGPLVYAMLRRDFPATDVSPRLPGSKVPGGRQP